ncbi:hypothetical protein EV715DRAFT_295909 [Schizophyllum commune]
MEHSCVGPGRLASPRGPAWRPDPDVVPQEFAHPAAPRYGPPADYQLPFLPQDFQARAPPASYLQGAYATTPSRVGSDAGQDQTAGEGTHGGQQASTRFLAIVTTPDLNRELSFDSDVPYVDFCSRIAAAFDIHPDNARFGFRVGKHNSSDGSRTAPTLLDGAHHFRRVIAELVDKNSRAKVHTSVLYMYDMEARRRAADAKAAAQAPKKRSREDDVPPGEAGNTPAGTEALQKLKRHTRCEKHDGYCHVKQSGGEDSHQALDIAALTFWARKMASNEADIYHPPGTLAFDARRVRTKTGSKSHEIHVHLPTGLVPSAGDRSFGQPRADSDNVPHTFPTPQLPSWDLAKDYPAIEAVLEELTKVKQPSDFMFMAPKLREMGIEGLDDMLRTTVEDIITYTNLPPVKVKTFFEFALIKLKSINKENEKPATYIIDSEEDEDKLVQEK